MTDSPSDSGRGTGGTAQEPAQKSPQGRRRPKKRRSGAGEKMGNLLPDITQDETDTGWSDDAGAKSDAEYFRERPPHW